MKKIFALLSTTSLLLSLTACGNTPVAQMPMAPQMNQQPATLQAQSASGIWKEINKGVEVSFKAQDKNGDKFITPDEFQVNNPDTFIAFDKLDSNNDGKVSMNEFAPGLFGRVADVYQIKNMASFLFDQLDRNNDKQLTQAEASASTLPGIAANFDRYRTKPWYSTKKLETLRKTDFENLVAFVMTNPNAAAAPAQPAPPAAPADPAAPPARR